MCHRGQVAVGGTEILAGSYNLAFVGLAVVMAVLASATALDVADRIGSSTSWQRLLWIAAAAVAMGGGIWVMHFIAMLAFSLPVPIAYDVPLTIASLLLAIAVAGVAFFIVCVGPFRRWRLALGGIIMGLGVAGMHYTGMAAMVAPAVISYQ